MATRDARTSKSALHWAGLAAAGKLRAAEAALQTLLTSDARRRPPGAKAID